MERRQFIKAGSILILGLLTTSKLKASAVISKAVEFGNEFRERIKTIIRELKREGSNLVKKVMNGKKYENIVVKHTIKVPKRHKKFYEELDKELTESLREYYAGKSYGPFDSINKLKMAA